MMNMTGTGISKKPQHGYRILVTIFAAVLGFGAIQSTSWANQPGNGFVRPTPSVDTEGTGSPAPRDAVSTPTLDETYASREAQAKSLESFKGGDVVIIGSTGAIIVLLVLLLLVIS